MGGGGSGERSWADADEGRRQAELGVGVEGGVGEDEQTGVEAGEEDALVVEEGMLEEW